MSGAGAGGPVRYIGIDLAWGVRNPTGVAVLDADARLLHVSAHKPDEEIDQALEPFVGGPCVVALDAPIVVTNATGSRPAEKALGRDFSRFEAGAYPANLGRPEFEAGSRAARLCTRLELDIDPDSRHQRRAIEVYPHAASIVLFDLAKTLKYKARSPGRDPRLACAPSCWPCSIISTEVVDRRRDGWAELRRQVDNATRKSELRVVEDQADAVICAYVALVRRHPPRGR